MGRANSSLVLAELEIPLEFSKEQYINYRIQGFSPRQSAMRAGYRSESDYMKWEEDEEIAAALRQHIAQNRRESLYDRDRVMGIIEDAVEIARIQGDPRSMIAGAQEFNKMQGFHAPERKHITLETDKDARAKQIQEMDEDQLLEALGKEQPYIDAEFEELPPDIPSDPIPNE